MGYRISVKPTKDIILIKPDKPKDRTDSGLYIKEDWKTLPPIGEVLAIGPDVSTVKVGDKVVYERYGAVKFDRDTSLCKESHIIARITDG